MTRVGLIEDQTSYAEALTFALERTDDFRVVCRAASYESGIESLERHRPDLAVVDYRLRGNKSGVFLARCLRQSPDEQLANIPIAILTGYPAPRVIRRANQLDNVSVVSKNSGMAELLSAFRMCRLGEVKHATPPDDPYSLSAAELEVLEYLALGYNAAEISREISRSLPAIRARIQGLLRRMDATSQLDAVSKAASLGLVAPPILPAHVRRGSWLNT